MGIYEEATIGISINLNNFAENYSFPQPLNSINGIGEPFYVHEQESYVRKTKLTWTKAV